MVLIRLMGGLGNQMFQYAFGKRMSIINNTELVLDQSLLLDKTLPHELVTHRNFDLDIFSLKKYRWATEKEIFSYNGNASAPVLKKVVRKIKNGIFTKKLIIQEANEFNGNYLSIKTDACFVGRWQGELYFEDVVDEIKKEFIFVKPFSIEIEKYRTIINNSNAVCLHVRRGDLITSPVYSTSIGVLDWSYYEKALAYIKEQIINPTFFIFSDDIAWCKQNIILAEQVYYMDDNTAGSKAEGHLYLMKQCKHFIISNSTFAWWGAWLSNSSDKNVVYPKNWYEDKKYDNPNMCPKRWMSF